MSDWTKAIESNPYGNRYLPRGRIDYQADDPSRVWGKVALEGGEPELIYNAARLVGGGQMVDLGTHQGGSAINMARGLVDRGLKGHVWTVDAYDDKGHGYALNQIKQAGVESHITQRKENTQKFAEYLRGRRRQLNFTFIDACHSYKEVKNDWKNYSALTVSGGMVAFHDTNQTDINKVIVELVDPDPNWKLEYWVNRIKAYRRK